jgi:hypothetical protein
VNQQLCGSAQIIAAALPPGKHRNEQQPSDHENGTALRFFQDKKNPR